MKLIPEIQPTNNPARILLVDDDLSLLKLLSLRLEAAGHQVTTAINGKEALESLQEAIPDVVLSDLRMDELDGLALFEEIQQNHPGLPVIILTAHGTIPDAVEATRQGVYGFLTKPVDKKELFSLIDKATAHRQPEAYPSWHAPLLARSEIMSEILAQAHKAAQTDINLLITGSAGTGKKLLAQCIHQASNRADQELYYLNCNSLPEELLAIELFGEAGQEASNQGLLSKAKGGTLYLEDLDCLPKNLQTQLLHSLQNKTYYPVGSTEPLPLKVRLLASSRLTARQLLEDANLREDLYYLIAVINLQLPDLSERAEDLPLLATHFLHKVAADSGHQVKEFSPEAMQLLAAAPWPGNIRQLIKVIEQCAILSQTSRISSSQVAAALDKETRALPSLNEARSEFERNYLIKVLKLAEGKVTEAARLAGRNRTDFYKLLNKHNLEAARFKEEAKRQKQG
ncbi:two-component system, NtrC family, response regulator GlrR [Marinospirillum celere]|uniref:Two-component system, NtrC family, response regulator GlrR n=1 Tax=Marinospirillum celere TaxID=1122252 RepID=A0A1I1ISC3_9GAMM|nr:sigma 54-interacting transcriptional regulator [Marinospirillum celere]SFC38632.1 two-component system, NtrC family, response regulator GlrR [Marinospirillum celere]